MTNLEFKIHGHVNTGAWKNVLTFECSFKSLNGVSSQQSLTLNICMCQDIEILFLPDHVEQGRVACYYWYMCDVPLVTCTIICCTTNTANLSLPAERQCWVTLPITHNRRVLKSEQTCLTMTCLISRDRWISNGKIESFTGWSVLLQQTNAWILPAAEELKVFITSS